MNNSTLSTDDLVIIKKNGARVRWDPEKILSATGKSAKRVLVTFTEEEKEKIVRLVSEKVLSLHRKEITIEDMHAAVEFALDAVNPVVAKSYRDFRNYKTTLNEITEGVITEENRIRFLGDKSNANKDAKLVATKRALIYGEWATKMYERFHLTDEEREAARDGYIYIHDKDSRTDTMNCFASRTGFITNMGVRTFRDFQDEDAVTVLTHKQRWKRAVVRCYGRQPLQEVTFRGCGGWKRTVLVTPNHRWILKDGTETTNLREGDKLYWTPDMASFDWDVMTEKEKKLWCLGFAYADGTVTGDYGVPTTVIRLRGNKSRFSGRFADAGYEASYPESMGGDPCIRMKNTVTMGSPFLKAGYEGMPYFVDGYLQAAGVRNLNRTLMSEFESVTVSGPLNDYMCDMLNVAGYYVMDVRDVTAQAGNDGMPPVPTKQYRFYSDCGDETWQVESIRPADEDAEQDVWCLEVEDDHSFILAGGIPTGNCCLFNMKEVMTGGFEMGNMWYNEPNSLDTAFDVMGDVILATAAQQYGGFTVPEVDTLLEPYAEKSYKKYFDEFIAIAAEAATLTDGEPNEYSESQLYDKADEYAMKRLYRECEQGMQGIEYKLNTVGSSRGDYPFTTFSFGLAKGPIGKMIAKVILRVRKEGQGKKGFKKPVLFPKLVFLYDEALHGEGGQCEDVFDEAIECSSRTMYPDYLSLTGEGYVPSMYKKYGKAISPMGCRAFLSPWYERGGMNPADENDQPVFIGRFNLGVVTLHLPMILQKARAENRDFYEVLDYYMEMIRGLHKRTIEYLGNMEASSNPTAYCEGGFLGGHLKPDEKIAKILKPCTVSFGITALNELQVLYNGKSIREDGRFAFEVMEHINDKINAYKKADGILYAVYGSPAEQLCGKQIEQFRAKYGVIEGVSSREYTTNSFHDAVWEPITPIEKQNDERRYFNFFNGGKIQYCRYPIQYNKQAIKTLVRRAMKLGFYEGVNLELSYCNHCGHQEVSMDVCPHCGSRNITTINRMNGYLGYSRVGTVDGDYDFDSSKDTSRYNSAKNVEVSERVSM